MKPLPFIMQYVRRYKYRYIAGILTLFAVDAASVFIPKLTGIITDGLTARSITWSSIRTCLLGIFLIGLLLAVGRFLWRYFLFGTARIIERELRNEMFSHLETMDVEYYNSHKTGDLMTRFTSDLNAVRMALGPAVICIFDSVVMTLLVVCQMMYYVNIKLTLLALIPMVIICLGYMHYGKVLDDLYTIVDIRLKDAYFQKIQELMERKDLWVVLISRAPFPAWLLSLRMKYSFVIIQEEDFCLTREQQDEYLERYGLQASDEQLARAWAVGRGNPMSLRVYVMENGDLEATMRTVWTYLESHVYDQWDTELQDFFMDVSIVKEFTVDLAAMITGNKHVEHMLAQGMETGNFFEKKGEKDGIWRCKDPMRWSMEQRLHKKRSPEQIRRLYYNAGLYYELEDDLPKALEMYKIYYDTESISRLLVANARKNAASGNYYELRKYYLELPEEIIRENPVLMMGMSLLQSILMNVEESERWYH